MNAPLMPCDLFPPQTRVSRTMAETGAGLGAPSETFAAVLSTQQGLSGSPGEPSRSARQSEGVDAPVEGDGSPGRKALQPPRRLADSAGVDRADPCAARVSPRGTGKHRASPLQQPATGNALGKHFPTSDAVPLTMPAVQVVDGIPAEPASQPDLGISPGTETVAEEDLATKDSRVRGEWAWVPALDPVTPRMDEFPISGETPDPGIPSGREDLEPETSVSSPVLSRREMTPAGSFVDAGGAAAVFQPAARPDVTESFHQVGPGSSGLETPVDGNHLREVNQGRQGPSVFGWTGERPIQSDSSGIGSSHPGTPSLEVLPEFPASLEARTPAGPLRVGPDIVGGLPSGNPGDPSKPVLLPHSQSLGLGRKRFGTDAEPIPSGTAPMDAAGIPSVATSDGGSHVGAQPIVVDSTEGSRVPVEPRPRVVARSIPDQDPSRASKAFSSAPIVPVGSVSNPDPGLSRDVARQIATAFRRQGPSQTESSMLVDPMPRLRVLRPEAASDLVEFSAPDSVELLGDGVATSKAPESGDARGPVAERQGAGAIAHPKAGDVPRRLGNPVDAESIQMDRNADQRRAPIEVGSPTGETVATSPASAGVRRERSILPRTAGGDRDSGIRGSRNPVENPLESVGSTTLTPEVAAGGRETISGTDLGGNGSQGSSHQAPSRREEDSRSLTVGHPALFPASTPPFGAEASAVPETVGDRSAASQYSASHWTQSADQTASHRRMEFDTLGQGRLQLTLTQVGDALRIDAVEVGNALSGTESGWQDLQQRLEQSGVILGSLQNDSGGDRQHRERPSPDPRHAACYEAGVGTSDHREQSARSPSHPSQAPRGEPGAWTESDASDVAQRLPQRVVNGREWWA